MSNPSVRMETDSLGHDHWVARDYAGGLVALALDDREGWDRMVKRALKVAAFQRADLRSHMAPVKQRSITDVGLAVADGHGHHVLEFYSPGKALWLLTRFGDRDKFEAGDSPLYCYVVEGVDPRTET